jgi:hypothetical protein
VRKLDFHPTAPVLCGALPADSKPRTASSQHFLYTPTYSSWLNLVERWFGLMTQRAIRRGSFSRVKDLIARIDSFGQHYNRSHRPFVWSATADSILQKDGFVQSFPGHDTRKNPWGRLKRWTQHHIWVWQMPANWQEDDRVLEVPPAE